jgi:hypothetical protein
MSSKPLMPLGLILSLSKDEVFSIGAPACHSDAEPATARARALQYEIFEP